MVTAREIFEPQQSLICDDLTIPNNIPSFLAAAEMDMCCEAGRRLCEFSNPLRIKERGRNPIEDLLCSAIAASPTARPFYKVTWLEAY